LKPATVDSLRSCVTSLSDRRVAFKVRGAAHSSGGQVLIDEGAVIDISGLRAVNRFDPERELISVQGGALWQDVVVALRPFGRIPMVWTNNLRTTVAGTLSVGGFGAPFVAPKMAPKRQPWTA
jgi:FAD/FMN-containing dehydrogenase